MIRTLLSACEERLGTKIKAEDKLVIFMAEYAAYLMNRLEVGKDGKTAYERCRGKRATVMAIEFGEKLLWKVRQKSKMEKLNPRWEYGVFVGVRAASGEIWVATKEGLQAVRSVRRIPVEERWSSGNKDFVRHVPWNKSGEDPEADGDLPQAPEMPAASGATETAAGAAEAPRVIFVNTREAAPREFYIKKRDVEAHGHTKGCPGCRTMFQGGTRQAHTAECRERFRGLMKDEEKVVRTEAKRKEYEEKVEEEAKRREEKKQRKEEKKAVKRGKKREAEDDDLERERAEREVPEEREEEKDRGQKRIAEEEVERENQCRHAGSSDDSMVIGGVVRNDEGAWDDVRGGWLDREEVRKARMEEVGYMKRKGLWDEVPRDVAEGQRVVSVKWVDTNKGTQERPEIRCRLVARDFRGADKDREDLFAATPPWELKKLLMSQAADRAGGKRRKMLLIDVKKAHLNSECKEDVFIELPEEVGATKNKVGKLRHWLYGFRPAAAAWENHYAGKLEGAGFARGLATPVSFYHEGRDVSLVVHGDDFTFTGEDADLDWAEGLMKQWYEVKVRARLGPGEDDDKEATLLGRILRWHDWGISCEADPKYRRSVLEALGLKEDSKSLASPGTKEADKDDESLPKVLGDDRQYRSIVATINFMAIDMPDIQFACKEACRDMSAPTEHSWRKVKRIGRYLVGREKVVWQFPWKDGHGGWKVYTDSDWAGDLETRKSTSGGILMLGQHCLKTWSTTQSSPALSSCEAEYYAVVDGASRALGMQTAAKELGIGVEELTVEMATDSSGAKSFASRRGSGRIRHIEVKWLWLQNAVADGRFRMTKVAGTKNPADIVTKYKSLREYQDQLRRVNVQVVGGEVAAGTLGGLGDASGSAEERVPDVAGKDCTGRKSDAAQSPPGRLSWAAAWEEEYGSADVFYLEEYPRSAGCPCGEGSCLLKPGGGHCACAEAEGECESSRVRDRGRTVGFGSRLSSEDSPRRAPARALRPTQ